MLSRSTVRDFRGQSWHCLALKGAVLPICDVDLVITYLLVLEGLTAWLTLQNNTAVTISGGGSSAASEYIIDFAAKATSLANQPVDITYNTTSSTSGDPLKSPHPTDF